MRYWLALKLFLLIGGVLWCAAIVRRSREDATAVRSPNDAGERYVVIGYWCVTALVAVLLVTFGLGVLGEVWALLRF